MKGLAEFRPDPESATRALALSLRAATAPLVRATIRGLDGGRHDDSPLARCCSPVAVKWPYFGGVFEELLRRRPADRQGDRRKERFPLEKILRSSKTIRFLLSVYRFH